MYKFFCSSSEYKKSDIVFLGLAFDATSSFRAGSRFAPQEVRVISDAIESYSPYLDKDLEDISFYDGGDIEVTISNTDKFLEASQNKIASYLEDNKKVFCFGGEHLVSLAPIKEHARKYEDLHIIHFDAHADLRDTYLDEKLSHATVMRRVCEVVHPSKIYQFGIRSGTKEEYTYAKNNTNFFPKNLDNFAKNIEPLKSKPVYITLDLDVLDPSIFAGTGTPEPGGITFNELLSAIKTLNDYNIVGIDVVELSPKLDSSGVSSIVAAKIVRELLLIL